ncbi:hypothetical protein [Noviherbaspirillum pedocola]|uniref:Uncharacterized protein n=1 Tax=Noviherbaspirillum pedocola TaxID=2801341 RepID=A0A934W9F4_9BURK|nr:hypothetical protein [Noviherbaspirillum pedocola]MBK4738028.1 hypothetical protein [Noviherbaspirillum pedocola]
MIRSNHAMRLKLPVLMSNSRSIANALMELLEDGFALFDGCTFLNSLLLLNRNARLQDYSDETGFECYVNSFHIEDYIEGGGIEQSLSFIFELFLLWNKEPRCKVLRAMISNDVFGTVIHFHVFREGESWLSEDIDEYEEAILIADSTDVGSLFSVTGMSSVSVAR